MNKQTKTKQNMLRNKKNKSRDRKDVEITTAILHSRSFPPQKTKPTKSAPVSPNPNNQQIGDDYVNRISCPIRRTFYEQQAMATATSPRTRKKKEFVPPQTPHNIRKAFPLIDGDKNIYKQTRNARGVYFTKVERQDSPIVQARYNMWKVKKVENRAMNTKAPQLSTYARHQQREDEKRKRMFHEDIIRRGNFGSLKCDGDSTISRAAASNKVIILGLLSSHNWNQTSQVNPKTSLIESKSDPHKNLTLTETMHVDIKPTYNMTKPNSPFKNKSPTHKMYNYSSDRYIY